MKLCLAFWSEERWGEVLKESIERENGEKSVRGGGESGQTIQMM